MHCILYNSTREVRDLSELSYDEFREIAQYAISRLDGAWFRVIAEKYGIPEAVDLDVKACAREEGKTEVLISTFWQDLFHQAPFQGQKRIATLSLLLKRKK